MAEHATSIETLEAQSRRILGVFEKADFERVAPPIIQPANLILDVEGESLRGRTYVFTDPDGEELCLRPDLTVPTCLLHLERHGQRPDVPARYCYSGRVFRYQPGGGDAAHLREFRQEGIESFSIPDLERAEAEIVAVALEATRAAGLTDVKLRLGDLRIFHALLDALDLPDRWRMRLRNAFWRPEAFRAVLKRLTSMPGAAVEGMPRELIDRLDPADPAAAEAAVVDHLARNGIELIGARSAAEIAESLMTAAIDARSAPLPAATAELIERYLSIQAPVRAASARLKDMVRERNLDISEALETFRRRLELLSAAGIDTPKAEFSAEFGRSFEYYSGFVFEFVSPQLGPRSPVAGGGRYDTMMRAVGAMSDVRAVGAAIYSERLALAIEQEGADD